MTQATPQQPCRNCGNLNPADQNFCARCGFPLKETLTGTMASNFNAPTMMSMTERRITGALVAGTMIGARYTVLRLLGRGGFGAVYLATDNRFPARRVAIKEMGDARLSPQERVQAIARFRQEANLLSSLQHPNLPAVSDFLEEGGKAYLVMDFIDGQTLDQVQKAAGGPLDEPLVMGWALQICEVLDYLHTQPQPIIFRDLKPPNVMVTPAGQIKLIDFGIARIFRQDAVADTNWLGSQGYAAPEQYGLGQEQTDARSDIYAFGAMLYKLLTNQEPLASFARVVNPGSLVEPRKLNAQLSTGVEQIILTAMQVEKRARYQSALQMAQAISALGFSSARNTGSMRALTGPNALTVAATKPGNYITSAPIQPASTEIDSALLPTTPSASSGGTSGPAALQTGSSMSTPGSLTFQSPVAQTGSTVQSSPASGPAAPAYADSRPMNYSQSPLPAGSIAQLPSGPARTPAAWPDHQTGGTPPGGGDSRISRRAFMLGGGALALAAATGVYFFVRHNAPGTNAGSGTVTVDFNFSTEKANWLQPAVERFNGLNQKLQGSSKTIQIQLLSDQGSVDSTTQIINGQLKPVAWSPASTLEANRLAYAWGQAHQGAQIISYNDEFQPASLATSPLVLASWQQRAQILLKYYGVTTLDWDTLARAFQVNTWAQIGGQEDWGAVKFGQTLPTQSNSGLLTITLLAYNAYHKARGLTVPQVNAAACWNYLNTFEGAVNAFGISSGTYLTKYAIPDGPPLADVLATYESLVLTSQALAESLQHQSLLIYYPALNILSDHPFVVLQGEWANDEQKQAALQFRDYLLSEQQQQQALLNGFRPANPGVSLEDKSLAGNPFMRQAGLFPHRQPDPLLSQAQPPAGDVVDALINAWAQHNPAPSHTNG